MKTQSYRHFLLTLSCQVVTKGHTRKERKVPQKAADLFKCG